MGIKNNLERKRFEEKSAEKSVKNGDFPLGHPSWHCTRPGTLNFGVKYTDPNVAASLTFVML